MRYKESGETATMRGLEGEITEVFTNTCTVKVTKRNGMYVAGELVHPNLKSLELLSDVVKEAVTHPAHYGGDTVYEVIKVCEAWGLDKDAYLFNVVKYVGRAGKKSKATQLEDLKKARFYLDRRIAQLEK